MTTKYERLTAHATAIATVISAIAALISVGLLIAGFKQVTLLRRQIEADHEKSANQTALELNQTGLQLLTDLETSRPINGSPCRRLVVDLNQDEFKSLLNRTVIAIPAALNKQAYACFSDQKPEDLKELLRDAPDGGKTLSIQAGAILAGRVNTILDADENIALAVNSKVANDDLVTPEMNCALEVDEKIVKKLTELRKFNYYPEIEKFVARHVHKDVQNFDDCVKGIGTVPFDRSGPVSEN